MHRFLDKITHKPLCPEFIKFTRAKKAFTLAEVLITLGIIGVVASLTIPTLLNYAFEQESVSKAKETYSILSQAVTQWQVEGGCVGESADCPEIHTGVYAKAHNEEEVARAISKYFKFTDSLYESAASGASPPLDWIPKVAYNIGAIEYAPTNSGANEVQSVAYNGGPLYSTSFFRLNNGVVVKFSGIWYHYQFTFDTNGAKRPNRLGKDQFTADLYNDSSKSITPYFYNSAYPWSNYYLECASGIDCNADDGHCPLAYVLKHNKLPDLKAMGYPTSP